MTQTQSQAQIFRSFAPRCASAPGGLLGEVSCGLVRVAWRTPEALAEAGLFSSISWRPPPLSGLCLSDARPAGLASWPLYIPISMQTVPATQEGLVLDLDLGSVTHLQTTTTGPTDRCGHTAHTHTRPTVHHLCHSTHFSGFRIHSSARCFAAPVPPRRPAPLPTRHPLRRAPSPLATPRTARHARHQSP